MDRTAPALIADLGATNARFALVDEDGIDAPMALRCAAYPDLFSAASAYLEQVAPPVAPDRGAIAIACPISGDYVEMTNHAWSFSIAELTGKLGMRHLEVVNDFTAQALAIGHLTEADRHQIGPGEPEPGGAIAVLGPGTGLGVSGLIPAGDSWAPITGEGGHVTMSAVNDREGDVMRRLRMRFNHVSAERVLSGMGLTNLYETLAAIDGADVPQRDPREVSEAALAHAEEHAVEAVEMFCAMLGTVAGNLALTLGSTGGVYIAGGIAPKLGEMFLNSEFRERFEAKGRFRDYLAPIPTYLVTHPTPAFLGLRSILDEMALA